MALRSASFSAPSRRSQLRNHRMISMSLAGLVGRLERPARQVPRAVRNALSQQRLGVEPLEDQMAVARFAHAPRADARKLRPVLKPGSSQPWNFGQLPQGGFDGIHKSFGDCGTGVITIPVHLSPQVGPEVIRLLDGQAHELAGLRRARRRSWSKCLVVRGRWAPPAAGRSNSANCCESASAGSSLVRSLRNASRTTSLESVYPPARTLWATYSSRSLVSVTSIATVSPVARPKSTGGPGICGRRAARRRRLDSIAP